MYEVIEHVLEAQGISRDDQDPMIVQEIADYYSDEKFPEDLILGTIEEIGVISIYHYIVRRKVPFTPGRKR